MRFLILSILFAVASTQTANAGELERETSRLVMLLKTATGIEHAKVIDRIAEIGPEAREAIPALVALWNGHRKYPSPHTPSTRSSLAAYALGEIGVEAMPQVKELLRHRDPKKRAWAIGVVHSIVEFGELHPDLRDLLFGILRARNVKVGHSSLHREALQVFSVHTSKFPLIRAEHVPLIATFLRDKDLASFAADALYEAGPTAKAAIPALVRAATSHPVPYDRMRAISALARINTTGKHAIPALTKCLTDRGFDRGPYNNFYVDEHAAEKLVRFGPKASTAVPTILKLIQVERSRKRPWFYGDLTKTLAGVRPTPKAAVAILRKHLRRKSKKEKEPVREVVMRVHAASALARIDGGNKKAVDLLITVAQDGRWDSEPKVFLGGYFGTQTSPRDAAVAGLAALGVQARTALPALQVLRKKRESVAWALFRIDPKFRVTKENCHSIIDELKSLPSEEAARLLTSRAKRCLQPIINDKCWQPRGEFEYWVDLLAKVKPDPLPRFAKAAAREGNDALLNYLGKRAQPAIPILVKQLTAKEPGDRAATARILGRLKLEPKIVVPALVKLLSDKRVIVRYEAARALGSFGPSAKPAGMAIKKATRDDYRSVRDAARNALSKIQSASN